MQKYLSNNGIRILIPRVGTFITTLPRSRVRIIIMAEIKITQKNGRFLNEYTGKEISPQTARKYQSFYRNHKINVPFILARGNRSSFQARVRQAQKDKRRIIARSPAGPVSVRFKNGKFIFRQITRGPAVKITPGQRPQIPPTPTAPTAEEGPIGKPSEEENVLKFGHAIERYLRRYAVLDLKSNPKKFGEDNEIEYNELYPSQQDLYKAMMAAQRSDQVGLRLSGGVTKERVNVMAEYLKIPTWRAKQTYFSDDTMVAIERKVHPITRKEVSQFRVYDIKKKGDD